MPSPDALLLKSTVQTPAANAPDTQANPASHASASRIVALDELPGVECACGIARRAFADAPEFPGTIHLTSITANAKTHYHQHHTEVYVILECEDDAHIELDGSVHPVRPKTSVLIPPGVRHRAVGRMTALIVSHPNFDPDDEFFD